MLWLFPFEKLFWFSALFNLSAFHTAITENFSMITRMALWNKDRDLLDFSAAIFVLLLVISINPHLTCEQCFGCVQLYAHCEVLKPVSQDNCWVNLAKRWLQNWNHSLVSNFLAVLSCMLDAYSSHFIKQKLSNKLRTYFECPRHLFHFVAKITLPEFWPEKVPKVLYFKKISIDFHKQGIKWKLINTASYFEEKIRKVLL